MAPFVADTLTLLANGQQLTGWTNVRVTRGIERCPNDFDISMTELYPGDARRISAEAGMSCQVLIGTDPVITGWIDRVTYGYGPRNHTIRLQGRGKCQDLTDCSITPDMLTGGQIFTSSLIDLATRLTAKFGTKDSRITVSAAPDVPVALSTVTGDPMKLNAVFTETGWELLERVARYLGVLLYEDTVGNLVIAKLGATAMASGFDEGRNVQAAEVTYAMDERYSVYLPSLMSTNLYTEPGQGGQEFQPAFDKGVTRYRPLVLVSEQFLPGVPFATARAKWEMARRAGRSQAVRLTCDTWRDKDGALWAPNCLAPINLPGVKLEQPAEPWVIATVTFGRDQERGTVTDVVLMPKEAFTPEPIILLPFLYNPDADPKPGGMLGHV